MTRRDAGDGTIRERPARPAGTRFEGRVWLKRDGRPYRKSVFGPTKAAVKAKLADEKLRARAGLQPTDERLTLAVYIDRWLARDRDVRERTVSRYRTLLIGHVVPVIGDRRLSELQPDDVRRVLDRMKARGLSVTTRRHVKTALAIALRDAEIDGLVMRNVARLVRVPAPGRTQARALYDHEIRAILAAVEGDRLGPLYAFAMATGARLGEILGLRWRDVDWQAGELHFEQTYGRLNGRDLWGKTKNEASSRTLAMNAGVRASLTAQKAAQESGLTGKPPDMLRVDEKHRRGPLVFTATDGGPLNPSYVTHHFQKLLTAAGIERLRLHDLRHGVASTLRAEGVAIEEISRYLGHSSIAVTQSVYLHLFSEGRQVTASKLDRFFADTGS